MTDRPIHQDECPRCGQDVTLGHDRADCRRLQANPDRLTYRANAESLLKLALVSAKQGGAPRLCQKIRSAIKSAGGAIRHARLDEARLRRAADWEARQLLDAEPLPTVNDYMEEVQP